MSKGLGHWRTYSLEVPKSRPPTCDTIACFGGWCAWVPEFREQGVQASVVGAPFIDTPSYFEGFTNVAAAQVSEMLFGVSFMFKPRGDVPMSRDLGESLFGALDGHLSDWQVVMNRINWLIKNSAVTP